MSTSMRIEVESKQQGAPRFVSDSAAGPGYTTTTRQAADPIQQGFRDAIAKQRNERETAERIAAREKADRKAADRQERDEGWLARQEARSQKKQEMEQERLQKQQESRQERDENYAEKQAARLQKQQEAEEAREAKRQESAAAKAARQQEKDENYYEQQQKRDQAARNAVNPQYLAQQMMQQQQLRQATQQQYIQAQLGISPGGVMSRVASTLGAVNNGVASFGTAIGAASKLLGGLGFVAGAVHGAWKHAIDTLLQESHRVAQYSPALRVQEVRNRLREMRTDRQIASEYGGQMADVQDRESRQEAAWRLIGTKLASAFEPMFKPFSEAYTDVLEWIAGSGKVNKESVAYLEKITKLSEQQLDAMGVSKRDQQDIADAVKTAEGIIKTMGSSGLDTDDPLKKAWGNLGEVGLLAQGVDNPGMIPGLLPNGWNQ